MTKKPFPTQARLHYLFDLEFDDNEQPYFIIKTERKGSHLGDRFKPTRTICNKGKRSEHLRDYMNVDHNTQQFGVWVWIYVNGDYDRSALLLDHINRDPLDNRPENLRLATWSDQIANRKLPKNWTSPGPQSPEHRAKIKQALTEMLWWNDGTINRKSKECPGPNFCRGLLKKTIYT